MSTSVRSADVAQALSADTSGSSGTPGVTLDVALDDLIAKVGRSEPVIETLRTGVTLFDETTGGLIRGEYAGIAAGPGVGKSLLADRVVLGVLRESHAAKALIFNLETATPVRAARLLCGASVQIGSQNEIAACLPLGPLLRGELEPPGIAYARESARRFISEITGRLRFIDNEFDARDIAATIRAVRPDVIVVDHFGLVTADWLGPASGVDRFDRGLHEVYAALREVNAAAILIAELTKAALATGTTDISSIRGSARFASLAGQQLTLVREGTNEQGDQQIRIELHKNRHGRSMVAQQATLYGGLGYLHFGTTAPLMIKKANKRTRTEVATDGS